MADEISIGKQAIKEVQDLRAELIKLSQDALSAGRSLSSINTPGGLNKAGADNSKASADLDTFKTKYIALSETVAKQADKSRLAEIRLQQQREKAFDSFERNAKKEQATIEKTNSDYNRTQTQINNLTRAYNDLAIRKERYNNLSTYEEGRLKTLQNVTEKYNGTLKTVDSQIGKNGRNVGNYASGFNGLSNSINQITREAPAAAVSMNTFFLAISNNLPMFFDEITKIRRANEELVKSGEPVKSVLKQVAGSFLSMGTLLSIGVTLLTLYGGKIVEWVGSLIKTETQLSAVARAQQSLNKAQSDAEKNTSNEITHLQLLASTAEDLKLPMESRKRAVAEMQELYPHYLGNLSQEAILAGETSVAMSDLAKNIMAAAVARGIEEEISKKAQSDYKSRKLLIGEINTDLQNYQKTLKSYQKVADKEQREAYELNAKVQFQQTRDKKLAALKALTEQQDAENVILISGYKKQVELSGKLGPDGKDEADKKVRVKKERREDIGGLESHLKAVGFLKDEIDAEISRLTTDRITGDQEALPAINFQLDLLIKLRKQLNDLPEADIKIVNNAQKSAKAIRELSEETKKYLKTFVDEFSSNSGIKNIIDSFDKDNPNSLFSKIKEGIAFTKENWQSSTVDIMESSQEMYNFIANNSKSNFESEKERLKSQYDVSIAFAGDNVAAKKKLEEDLEKKQKEIANREAKAKKQQAIFNIAIDTAQAVVASLPNFVLAGIVAAFGLAQALVVSSQKVPQYWMGGTHEGGLMMVNDGAGSNYRETIVTPDGGIHKPTGRNVLMNAPKGTEIFTHDQWNDQMNNMLRGNNIQWNDNNNSSGSSFNYDAMDGIMHKYLGNVTVEKTVIDKDGFSNYVERQGSKTKINRSFASSKGFRFS